NGEIPEFRSGEEKEDENLEQFIKSTVLEVEEAMEEMQFSVALSSIWKLVSRTNKYIDETEPWILAREDAKRNRLGNVMAHLAESIRITAVMLQPFLTETPKEV